MNGYYTDLAIESGRVAIRRAKRRACASAAMKTRASPECA